MPFAFDFFASTGLKWIMGIEQMSSIGSGSVSVDASRFHLAGTGGSREIMSGT